MATVVVVSIGFFDKPLTIWLHENISQTDYGFWRSVSKIGNATIWYILGIGMLATSEVRRRMAWTLAGAGGADASCPRLGLHGAVHAAQRRTHSLAQIHFWPHPAEDMLNTDTPLYGFYPFSGEQSFPSGHSQAIFSAMVALGILFPRHRWWFIGIATMVAFSRVATYQHFLSDVIAGSAIGTLVTLGLARRFSKKASLRLGKSV